MQQYLKVSMTILILLFIPGTLSCCSKSTSSPKTSGREVEFNQSANSTASQIPALVTTSLISQSHVSGNMPDTQVFDQLLQNDLNEQMTKKLGKPVKVSYELLRKAPTQAGTGFPKFYCWVKVLENYKVIEEGAIRVAAMEKKHFEIYQFMSLPQIRKDPQWVYEVYPKVLCEGIFKRAGITNPPAQDPNRFRGGIKISRSENGTVKLKWRSNDSNVVYECSVAENRADAFFNYLTTGKWSKTVVDPRTPEEKKQEIHYSLESH